MTSREIRKSMATMTFLTSGRPGTCRIIESKGRGEWVAIDWVGNAFPVKSDYVLRVGPSIAQHRESRS